MREMSCGCLTAVHPEDLADKPVLLYVGVGGGLEALQFAYSNWRYDPNASTADVSAAAGRLLAEMRSKNALNAC